MAEMVRGGKEGGDPNEVDAEIDEELMIHIFNMYAAYTLRTSSLVVADQSKTTDMGDTSKVTTEVTAGVAIEGPQADSSSLSAPSLVLHRRREPKPSLLSHPATEPRRCHPRTQNSLQQDSARPQRRGCTATASLPFADKKFRGMELNPKLIGQCFKDMRHWTLQGCYFGRSLKIWAWA